MPLDVKELTDDDLLNAYGGITSSPTVSSANDLSDDDLLSHFGQEAPQKASVPASVNTPATSSPGKSLGEMPISSLWDTHSSIPLTALKDIGMGATNKIAGNLINAASYAVPIPTSIQETLAQSNLKYAKNPLAQAGGVAGEIGSFLGGAGAATGAAKAVGSALPSTMALAGKASEYVPYLLSRAARAGGIGALQGFGGGAATSQDPVETAKDTAVLGAGLNTVGNVAQAITESPVRPEIASLARKAIDDFGIDIPAARISTNPLVKWLDAALPDIPGSGHGGEMGNATSQFTRAVSNTFGENTSTLDRATMHDAEDRIGKKFNKIANKTPKIGINDGTNDNIINRLSSIRNDANEVLGEDGSSIAKQIDKINNLAGIDGKMSGKSWIALTRSGTPLDRLVKSPDPNVSYYARQIKDTLYDALEGSAHPDLSIHLRTAQTQWKNLKTVSDLANKAGITGEINPVLLMTKVNQTGKRFGEKGLSSLQDLGDIGQQFFKNQPSSGTAQRTMVNTLLASTAGAGGALLAGHPEVAAASLLAAGATIPIARTASSLINSNAYRNMLLNSGVNPLSRFLTNPELPSQIQAYRASQRNQ